MDDYAGVADVYARMKGKGNYQDEYVDSLDVNVSLFVLCLLSLTHNFHLLGCSIRRERYG